MIGPKDLKNAAATLALELNEAGLLNINGVPIRTLLRIIERHLRELVPEKCSILGCRNEARYTSGFCGVCDVVHNAGKGTRKADDSVD